MKIDKNSLPENVRGLADKTKVELLNIIDRKDHVEKELNKKVEELNKKVEETNKKINEVDYSYNIIKKHYSDKCENYNILLDKYKQLQQDYLKLKEEYETLESKNSVLERAIDNLRDNLTLVSNEKQELEAMNNTLGEKCNSLEKKNNTLLLDIKAIDTIKKQFANDNEKLSEEYSVILAKLERYTKNNNFYKVFFVIYTIILIVLLLSNLM